MLVLVDFTRLAAVGINGVQWESDRLCLDGLKVQGVTGTEIHCEGDYLEATERFVVDARDGRVLSGRPFIDPFS